MIRAMLVLALLAGRALADPPWATGVSEAERAIALDLYDRGNVEFESARFPEALAYYREAITHWAHPAIRYNMAVAYNSLGQLLEAHESLELGLAFGEAPLGHDHYLQALNYRQNFASRLARIQIRCREPDATVRLDGRVIFTGPGERDETVLPGEHQVVATKIGHLTAQRTLLLAAGEAGTSELELVALTSPRLVRRWPAWKPWALAIGGGTFAGLGAILQVFAIRNVTRYDYGIAEFCPHGCTGAMVSSLTDLTAMKHTGERMQDVAMPVILVGGAAVIAGAVGIFLNLPRTVTDHVAPAPVPGGALLAAGWQF